MTLHIHLACLFLRRSADRFLWSINTRLWGDQRSADRFLWSINTWLGGDRLGLDSDQQHWDRKQEPRSDNERECVSTSSEDLTEFPVCLDGTCIALRIHDARSLLVI